MKTWEITQAARGTFHGRDGRKSYELEAGVVDEKDVDPEVLERLVVSGVAVKPKPVKSEIENGDER